jgi:predicted DsbA family dithiol-disulfide isomerase
MKTLRVDVWSDIACPWCWIGKRRLDEALQQFRDHRDTEVIWRAFELDPSFSEHASSPHGPAAHVPYARRLARKYGSSVEAAEARLAQITELAAAEGLALRFDRVHPTNTFDAHGLLHLALDHGVQEAVQERLFRAYLSDGELISDHDTLVRIAASAGLRPEEVRATLASDIYDDEVREDEAEAAELGILGVPFFVFGGRYAVSGAQPPDILVRVLTQAWSALEPPGTRDEQAARSPGSHLAVCRTR